MLRCHAAHEAVVQPGLLPAEDGGGETPSRDGIRRPPLAGWKRRRWRKQQRHVLGFQVSGRVRG